VYLNIRAGFDNNLIAYLHEHSIAHGFHHNAFLVVSNGDRARYGSITSQMGALAEWKRNDEKKRRAVDAEVLLNRHAVQRSIARYRENYILLTTASRAELGNRRAESSSLSV